jgi:hypothetical protein
MAISDDVIQLAESGAITGMSDTLRALEKARIACLAHAVVDRLAADPLVSWEEARLLTVNPGRCSRN